MPSQDVEALARGDELLKVWVEQRHDPNQVSDVFRLLTENGTELDGEVILSTDHPSDKRSAHLELADEADLQVEFCGHVFGLPVPIDPLGGKDA